MCQDLDSFYIVLHGGHQSPSLSNGPRLCSNHHIHLPIGKEEKRKKEGILVIHCCVTTLKMRGLKLKHVLSYNFCGSEIQVWLNWVLWLRVSYRSAPKVLAQAVDISRLKLGRICFQYHSCGYWQVLLPCRLLGSGFQFLTACWPEVPSVPCHVGFSIRQLTTW